MTHDWPVCIEPDCGGARMAGSDLCVRHDRDDELLGAAIRDGVDARGVLIDEAVWARIRAVAPLDRYRAVLGGEPRFGGATFDVEDLGDTAFGKASFHEASFGRGTSFSKCTFAGADFSRATFHGEASFHDVECSGSVSFSWARFLGPWALFTLSRFDRADFLEAEFAGKALFPLTKFRHAQFNSARFAQEADFDKLEADTATFVGARFDGELALTNAVLRNLSLDRIRYAHPLRLGPLTVLRLFTLDHAIFEEPVTILAAADYLSAAGTRFREQARLELRWAEVALSEARFARPSIIALTRELGDDPRLVEACAVRDRNHHPRVVSLRDADVDGLFLAGVDLRACRLSGARNLDRLRIGSGCTFARSPPGARWADREVLAEEHLWRAQRGRGEWNPPECHAPDWLRNADDVPPPGVIAGLYRDLRKAREDHKDEPGAASFYYGEMEMRRHDDTTEWTERRILDLYWLVAGYGLRASRALAALALTVVVFAAIFAAWGFTPDQGFGRALLFSAESTSSLFRVPPTTAFSLTPAGEVAQLAVRLLGPLFFALALISLRGRVKRG